MYVSVIHRLFLSLILQALLNNFVKVRVILVNKSGHLEDLFWFHMIPKFLHDFVIKEQVASVVELLDIAQDYKKVINLMLLLMSSSLCPSLSLSTLFFC